MGFENNMGFVRRTGRKIVLPTETIKRKLETLLFQNNKDKNKIHTVIDIGSGTLYWSEWLSQYVDKVYAVDLVYPAEEQKRKSARGGVILCSNNIEKIIKENNDLKTMVWMCDVLHHMPESLADDVLGTCLEKYKYIAVKDINCRNRFGNLMNRLHDRVINKEKIRDIDPIQLEEIMVKKHFKVYLYGIRRLWYPHFLLVAVRNC